MFTVYPILLAFYISISLCFCIYLFFGSGENKLNFYEKCSVQGEPI